MLHLISSLLFHILYLAILPTALYLLSIMEHVFLLLLLSLFLIFLLHCADFFKIFFWDYWSVFFSFCIISLALPCFCYSSISSRHHSQYNVVTFSDETLIFYVLYKSVTFENADSCYDDSSSLCDIFSTIDYFMFIMITFLTFKHITNYFLITKASNQCHSFIASSVFPNCLASIRVHLLYNFFSGVFVHNIRIYHISFSISVLHCYRCYFELERNQYSASFSTLFCLQRCTFNFPLL